MLVLHDMKLMLIYYGAAFFWMSNPKKRKELVVERLSDAHVFDGYLYVVNDRLHGFPSVIAQSRPGARLGPSYRQGVVRTAAKG